MWFDQAHDMIRFLVDVFFLVRQGSFSSSLPGRSPTSAVSSGSSSCPLKDASPLLEIATASLNDSLPVRRNWSGTNSSRVIGLFGVTHRFRIVSSLLVQNHSTPRASWYRYCYRRVPILLSSTLEKTTTWIMSETERVDVIDHEVIGGA